MIAKLQNASNFLELGQYLLGPRDNLGRVREEAIVIGGTVVAETPQKLAEHFVVFEQMRPHVKHPGYHVSLRLHPNDDRPSRDTMRNVGTTWAIGMGIDAFAIVSHGDHIHIVCSRIKLDGSIADGRYNWRRSERLVRHIEVEFGLKQVPPSHLIDTLRATRHRRAPGRRQYQWTRRTGKVLPATRVADRIDEVLGRGSCSIRDFIDGLGECHIEVRINTAPDGRIKGLSYRSEGRLVTSKALGRAYTWSNLQLRGLTINNLPSSVTRRGSASSRGNEDTLIAARDIWSLFSPAPSAKGNSEVVGASATLAPGRKAAVPTDATANLESAAVRENDDNDTVRRNILSIFEVPQPSNKMKPTTPSTVPVSRLKSAASHVTLKIPRLLTEEEHREALRDVLSIFGDPRPSEYKDDSIGSSAIPASFPEAGPTAGVPLKFDTPRSPEDQNFYHQTREYEPSFPDSSLMDTRLDDDALGPSSSEPSPTGIRLRGSDFVHTVDALRDVSDRHPIALNSAASPWHSYIQELQRMVSDLPMSSQAPIVLLENLEPPLER